MILVNNGNSLFFAGAKLINQIINYRGFLVIINRSPAASFLSFHINAYL